MSVYEDSSQTLKRERWHLLFAAFAVCLLVALTGCKEQTPSEKMGDAVEDMGDAVEDAADDMGDAMEDAGDDMQDATH